MTEEKKSPAAGGAIWLTPSMSAITMRSGAFRATMTTLCMSC